MKEILVLGGTRFFGVHLVKELLSKGHNVTIATRGITADIFGDKVKRIVFDRHDEEQIIKCLSEKSYDIIYDNLAYSSEDIEILLPYIKCKKYIVTSSASVYNPLHGEIFESNFNPKTYEYCRCKREDVEYCEGKRQVETSLYQQFANVDFICVRFPFVIGMDDYTNRLYKYIESYIGNFPLYIDNIRERMSFISSKEAGQFLSFLSDIKGFRGVINGCSDDTISIYEIFKMLDDEKNINQMIMNNFSNPLYEQAPYNGNNDHIINCNLAKRLGYRFSNINDWIKPLIDFYQERAKTNYGNK